MRKIFFLFLTLAFCSLGFAQNNKENSNREKYEQKMAEIQSRKIAFFTKHLQLTSEEAQNFWPVYNKCEEERYANRKEIRKSAKALHIAAKDANTSDESMRSLAETYYQNLDREASLQKLHYYEYLKVLPAKKAALVRLVEERFMNELLTLLSGKNIRNQNQKKEKVN